MGKGGNERGGGRKSSASMGGGRNVGGEVACGGDGEYGGRVHADMLPLYIFDFLDDDQKRRFPTPKFGFRHPTDHFRSF